MEAAAGRVRAMLAACTLCPRQCRQDRLGGETGFCGVGSMPRVSSAGPHFGEEAPLVGQSGSGTIFMSGCNLGCVFCQNSDISHNLSGEDVTISRLADMMLALERIGCHNINFVTPTHQAHAVMESIIEARKRGLSVPVVYNCGGYEPPEVLVELDGFVQIYMPDAKFIRPESSSKYCGAPDYPGIMKEALRIMRRQVGDLVIENGIAVSGLIVRHLVMPGCADEGTEIIDFLADEISPDTYVNVMPQYRPCFKAQTMPEIARYPTRAEFMKVRDHALERGLRLTK